MRIFAAGTDTPTQPLIAACSANRSVPGPGWGSSAPRPGPAVLPATAHNLVPALRATAFGGRGQARPSRRSACPSSLSTETGYQRKPCWSPHPSDYADNAEHCAPARAKCRAPQTPAWHGTPFSGKQRLATPRRRRSPSSGLPEPRRTRPNPAPRSAAWRTPRLWHAATLAAVGVNRCVGSVTAIAVRARA
jgi:hypothetical protein